jgi:hypothetical protein
MTEAGAIGSSETLAAGICSEHPTRLRDNTRPMVITGSFIVLAYVCLAHTLVSHTPRDDCK